MKTMSVADVKIHFSKILSEVSKGEKIGILYGKAKRPVAMIVPYKKEKIKERKIGLLDGKATIEFADDFEMSEEELIGAK